MKSRRLSVLLTAWTRHPSSPLPSGPRLGLARVGLEGQAFQWGFLQTVGGELRTARPCPLSILFSRESDPGFDPGFPSGSVVKNPPAGRSHRRCGFDPWVGKIPWRRAWQPASVFLRGESHGQRSLAGCSPWGHKESDTTGVT